ncbi:MAG TPA: secondary thiamine-phosphate synthase enzyme YjbQ [Paludibacteraceae bacterium]|nr:secondary thiamine-phosphate synthase enzyme YjbQ [Paludibacteraceae bacterium]
MIFQTEITLQAYRKGCHLITRGILQHLPVLPEKGLLHLFLKHTSAALTINENADPDVQTDLFEIFSRLVPENQSYYEHTLEGSDDMPAHAKSTLSGVSLLIPITNGHLNLGIWQGIYLCEFRNRGGNRTLVATIIS